MVIGSSFLSYYTYICFSLPFFCVGHFLRGTGRRTSTVTEGAGVDG